MKLKIALSILLLVLALPSFALRGLHSDYELLLNVPTKKLLLFNNGTLVKEYPVGVGKSLTPTPLGDFKIVRRINRPAWVNPYRQSKVIPPGKFNPIGSFWLGFAMNRKNQEYGFHATTDLNSVGKASTHGCVRMYPKHIEELFNLVTLGTPVHVIYNPIEVKEYENKLFVRAYPDIYSYMNDTEYLKFARNQLIGANLVKEKNLFVAISNKDEKDYFIGWTGSERLNEQDTGPIDRGSLGL